MSLKLNSPPLEDPASLIVDMNLLKSSIIIQMKSKCHRFLQNYSKTGLFLGWFPTNPEKITCPEKLPKLLAETPPEISPAAPPDTWTQFFGPPQNHQKGLCGVEDTAAGSHWNK